MMLSCLLTKRAPHKAHCVRNYSSSSRYCYSHKGDGFSFEKDFGKYVFNEAAMETHLSPNVLKKYKNYMKERKPIDIDTADAVALAMKDWATSLGATHFTHWFQPLNGWIAEKHDSFVGATHKGRALSQFKGKALIGGNLMLLVFLAVVFVRLMKLEVIQFGIHKLLLFFLRKVVIQLCIFLLVSIPILERHWIVNYLCSDLL